MSHHIIGANNSFCTLLEANNWDSLSGEDIQSTNMFFSLDKMKNLHESLLSKAYLKGLISIVKDIKHNISSELSSNIFVIST